MILLLGGITEAGKISKRLAAAGLDVLLSTATTIPPKDGLYPGVRLRTGPLDKPGIMDIIQDHHISCVVDATHPYAGEITTNAYDVCKQTGTFYVAYNRRGILPEDAEDVHWAKDHMAAAGIAGSFGKPVLLTIGVRNLLPYVTMAKEKQIAMVTRVLDVPASRAACKQAGLAEEAIICANGPFSMEENAELIRQYHIGVLVTKDSGTAGGVNAKLAAARKTDCHVIAVRRPPRPTSGFNSVSDVIDAVLNRFSYKDGGTHF